jgi:hypothetical protein
MDIASTMIASVVVASTIPSGAAALHDDVALDPRAVTVDDGTPAVTARDAS